MYLRNGTSGYDSSGQQVRRRGSFLLFLQPKDTGGIGEIRCVVRKVALQQCGHWMMGRARLYGHSIIVSGAYGHDGLPCNVPQAIYDRCAVTLPPELYDSWSKGNGWNSSGSEGPVIREWALQNFDKLTA